VGVGKFIRVSRSEISLRVKGERPNSLRNDTRSPRIELQRLQGTHSRLQSRFCDQDVGIPVV
jgi:hypothetical protein